MPLLHTFRKQFVLFYISGQTSYIPLQSDHSKLLKFVSIFIRIVYIILTIWDVVTDIRNRSFQVNSETFKNVVLCLIIVINFLPILLSFYTNAMSRCSSSHICDLFANLIQYIECNLKCHINIDRFKVDFFRTLILQIAIETVASIARYIFDDIFIGFFDHVCLTFWKAIKIFAISYTVFYVNLVVFLMKTVNLNLIDFMHDRKRMRQIFATLRHLKWFHYQLRQILMNLNERFGLLFLVFLIHFFLVSVLTIFRILILWPTFVITSKFEIIICFPNFHIIF